MRTIVYLAMAMVSIFLQTQLFPMVFHGTWLPNLMLAWIVVITIVKGRKAGVLVAILAGLVHDILMSNFFGLHFFPYLIVAYVASLLNYRLYEEHWYLSFLAVVVATIVNSAVVMLMLYMAKETVQVWSYLWHHVLPALIANGVLGIIVHEVIWSMEEKDEVIW